MAYGHVRPPTPVSSWFEIRRVGSRSHAAGNVRIANGKDFKIMTVATSAGRNTCESRGSRANGAGGVSVLLLSMASLLGLPVYAQGIATGNTERLAAQMQSAAAAAAGHPKPPAPAATPNPNCTLIVPKEPFTAAGLATPYELVATDPGQGPCNESNTAQSAFVQAAIFDPATGSISIYNPLVIDKGDKPLAPTVVPTLPAKAIVATWFGYNGDTLILQAASGSSLTDSGCVNGTSGSAFGQYSYCNAPALMTAATAAVASGQLKVPALGTAADGKPCPTLRDFFVVDQDQSDNLPTLYLVSPKGHIAQMTAKNQAAHPKAVPLSNASDNRLLDAFIDPALSCKPWTTADLANPGAQVSSLVLNELQARSEQATPVALVPAGDPMALVNGNLSLNKTNLYRQGVADPTAESYNDVDTARYCREIVRTAPQRMLANQKLLTAFTTPDAGAASSLYTFLAQRLVASWQLLNCATLINQADPVSVTLNGQGVAVSATVNTTALNAIVQKLAPQKAADDAADCADKSLHPTEN
jgi:hypothetical protein